MERLGRFRVALATVQSQWLYAIMARCLGANVDLSSEISCPYVTTF
jgi:hypothetical protein